MVKTMGLCLDSLWRAGLYFCHPRTLALALMPLLVLTAVAWSLGYFFWDLALDRLSDVLSDPRWLNSGGLWLEALGWGRLKQVVAPLLVILSVTPFLVMISLLAVMVFMLPALVSWVGRRRFAILPKQAGRAGADVWWRVLQALWMAILALIVSSPLWLVPPMVMVLPPLIWGWLGYRVLPTAVLAAYSRREERVLLLQQHRVTWLLMSLFCGYLAALPTLIWVSGTLWATAFAVLVPLAMAIYVAVFALAGLWFAHYGLAALLQLRQTDSFPGN